METSWKVEMRTRVQLQPAGRRGHEGSVTLLSHLDATRPIGGGVQSM